MNSYTLEPSKQESVTPSAPAPVTASVYMPPAYQQQPYHYPPASTVQADVRKIRDWLAWSVISLFTGGFIGLLPLIFSLICRSKKGKNDLSGARTMSTLALVFNIIITIIVVVALIGLMAYFLYFSQTIKPNY